jgi:hypothetical protein
MVEGPLGTVESCMGMVWSRASDEAMAEYRQRLLLGLLPAVKALMCWKSGAGTTYMSA